MVMLCSENETRGDMVYGISCVVLADDYARMLADGMLLDRDEPFDVLMEHCAEIEARANGLYSVMVSSPERRMSSSAAIWLRMRRHLH